MKAYVASSSKGERHHTAVVRLLRNAGYTVYDWAEAVGRFPWSAVGLDAEKPAAAGALRRGLAEPVARRAFASDAGAVAGCDVLVLVQPAGRSAHLEAGYAAGAGIPVVVYVPPDEPQKPDLMLSWARVIVGDLPALRAACDEAVARGRSGIDPDEFAWLQWFEAWADFGPADGDAQTVRSWYASRRGLAAEYHRRTGRCAPGHLADGRVEE